MEDDEPSSPSRLSKKTARWDASRMHCPAATVILYLSWFPANWDKHEKNSLDAFCTVSINPRWTSRESISEEESSQECRYLRYEISSVNPSGTDLRRTVSTAWDEGKRHRSNRMCMGSSALRAGLVIARERNIFACKNIRGIARLCSTVRAHSSSLCTVRTRIG